MAPGGAPLTRIRHALPGRRQHRSQGPLIRFRARRPSYTRHLQDSIGFLDFHSRRFGSLARRNCLSTCRRNRPPSGRLGCVTSSSASGAIVIILVPCRVVATMILLSSLRVSQNQQPQGCPVVGFSSSGASAASGDVAARAVIEGIGPDRREEVWHSGRWDQKHSSIRQQESRGDRTNVSTCVGIGLTKSSTMASPDVGSKKRSVLRNFLSQPARSASNEGELLCVLPHADMCSV